MTKFGPMPQLCIGKIGYGMGTKDFEAANCVRAMLGRSDAQPEQIVELCCNLDDMTPEDVGFAMERLFDAGALDVWTTPIGMKKNRPGVLLTCMCREDDREAMLRTIFRHTSTLGVRVSVCDRYTLSRRRMPCRRRTARSASRKAPAGAYCGARPNSRIWRASRGRPANPSPRCWTRFLKQNDRAEPSSEGSAFSACQKFHPRGRLPNCAGMR